MKAAIALLANAEAHNFVRRFAWSLHQQYGLSLEATCLPPHVSLKQPFAVSDLGALEAYLNELAGLVPPIEVALSELQLVHTTLNGLDTGILWLDVRATSQLRQLHNRICSELETRLGNTQAPFDGVAYHFHMTIALGAQHFNIYQTMYEKVSGAPVDVHYTAKELALFVYDDEANLSGGYMTYKILPLSGSLKEPLVGESGASLQFR